MAVHNLAVGAKRYDGISGSAVFAGVIPLKPGQLFEVRVAPSPTIPITANAVGKEGVETS